MVEFLHEMKGIADELALAQASVDDEDLILHILTQVRDNYKHITVALKVRDTPLTFSDRFSKLVDYEQSMQETQLTPIIATINQTQKQPSRYSVRIGYDSRNHTRSNNFTPRKNKSQTHNSGSKYTSRGNRNSLSCQYCNFTGHDTKVYQMLAWFLQENNITISLAPPSTLTINYSMATTPSHTPPWMFDSEASHHVTSDRSSLHTLSEFGGLDEIVLGNGKCLPISHIGHTSLPTHSRSLDIQNVLFIP
nr:putative zinc finger, CCHC-type [Tanacetum cinerariifolium]